MWSQSLYWCRCFGIEYVSKYDEAETICN